MINTTQSGELELAQVVVILGQRKFTVKDLPVRMISDAIEELVQRMTASNCRIPFWFSI